MRARLRTAWKGDLRIVGARLHAEVAAAAAGVELVAGQRGQVAQRLRPARGQAESIVEERRPQPEGHRQPGGRQAERLAGVGGRRELLAGVVADEAPRGHPLGRARPLAQQVAQVARPQAVLHVERREVQPVLRRGRDAGLVLAVKRDDLRSGVRSVVAGLAPEREPSAAGRGGKAARAGGGQQSTARERHA
jgi:hypothetical protein